MDLNQSLPRSEESDILLLQRLYARYGYSKFRMSKFEDYSLYLQNKDFLKGGNIITFTGPNGRLLALKQDITLSIIKNAVDSSAPHRVYYVENVYRASDDTGDLREIPQAGVEYIGQIDAYVLSEVILLALESLAIVSDQYILGISHMGLVRSLLEKTGLPQDKRSAILSCIQKKSCHEIQHICTEYSVDPALTEKICTLSSLYGSPDACKDTMQALAMDADAKAAVDELYAVYSLLCESGHGDQIRIDFSVSNNMKYYNGIAFQGFVDGTPCSVLSGGRYDDLMHKFGRKSGAIGFAVYLDLLKVDDRIPFDEKPILVLYDPQNTSGLAAAVRSLQKDNSVVQVLRSAPKETEYSKVYLYQEGRLSLQ